MGADRCEVCGDKVRPWQKAEEFDVGTLIGSSMKVTAHDKCASLKASTAIHMRAGHARTILCAVLKCAS